MPASAELGIFPSRDLSGEGDRLGRAFVPPAGREPAPAPAVGLQVVDNRLRRLFGEADFDAVFFLVLADRDPVGRNNRLGSYSVNGRKPVLDHPREGLRVAQVDGADLPAGIALVAQIVTGP